MKNRILELIKYLFSAGSSFVIDLILFTIFNALLNPLLGNVSIIISTICARVLSSIYNYFLNSRYVFKKFDNKSIIKYYALTIIQMFISSFSVYQLKLVLDFVNPTIIKSVVDIIIFIVNYIIQREVVFK